MSVECIEKDGTVFAEVIRAETKVKITRFFSAPESSFQFGLLAHGAGFEEAPHYHHPFKREINDLQQVFVMQRGVVAVDIYDNDRNHLKEIILRQGDAIVLARGIHGLRVIEDFQAISVKQGPFLGTELDKVMVEVTK